MSISLQSCTRYGKHLSLSLAITLGVTHCAPTSDGQLAQGQGAAMGAAGGALLGNLVGGNTRSTLIGAGIGSLAGLAYGTHIANKKASYASTEAWLDDCIVQANKRRREAAAYNSRLGNQLARLQKEVRVARAAGDRNKLAALKSEIVAERSGAEKQISAYSKETASNRSAISQAGGEAGSRVRTLRASNSGIESQVSTMSNYRKSYASLENQTIL